jgi:hypothetical protein
MKKILIHVKKSKMRNKKMMKEKKMEKEKKKKKNKKSINLLLKRNKKEKSCVDRIWR